MPALLALLLALPDPLLFLLVLLPTLLSAMLALPALPILLPALLSAWPARLLALRLFCA